ncbi:MAG TPA: hypothetical protein VIL20_28455 [Sandaracinaceae bacterium]
MRGSILSVFFVMAIAWPASGAEAQTGTVQHVPPPPPSYGAPSSGPPTYGQPYAQPTYGQPYGQPAYVPTYHAPARRVRYVERETSIPGLWIPGIIIFGVSYGLTTAAATLSSDGEYADYSLIPLVGPWLMLGTANNDEEVAGALVSGLAQAAGMLMFVLGLSLRERVRVAVYSLEERDERAPRLALEIAPAPAGGVAGLSLSHF